MARTERSARGCRSRGGGTAWSRDWETHSPLRSRIPRVSAGSTAPPKGLRGDATTHGGQQEEVGSLQVTPLHDGHVSLPLSHRPAPGLERACAAASTTQSMLPGGRQTKERGGTWAPGRPLPSGLPAGGGLFCERGTKRVVGAAATVGPCVTQRLSLHPDAPRIHQSWKRGRRTQSLYRVPGQRWAGRASLGK